MKKEINERIKDAVANVIECTDCPNCSNGSIENFIYSFKDKLMRCSKCGKMFKYSENENTICTENIN